MRKLLYSNGSPYARQVRILLAEKSLKYESDVNDMLRPVDEIRPHNPALQVPVLYDGEYHLFGSDLICDYLMSSYPTPEDQEDESRLAPAPTRANSHWEDRLVLGAINELAVAVLSLRLYSLPDSCITQRILARSIFTSRYLLTLPAAVCGEAKNIRFPKWSLANGS